MHETQETERRGRPRSVEADRAILDATIRLFRERGFDGTSIEAIAQEAGVGKTTVYRRFRDKADVITAAIAEYFHVADVPDTGSLRGDLLAIMGEDAMTVLGGPGCSMLGTFLAERERNPQLIEAFRRRIIGPRRRQYHQVFERAIKRGELKPDIPHERIATALFGSAIAQLVIGELPTAETAEEVIDLVLEGVRPSQAL